MLLEYGLGGRRCYKPAVRAESVTVVADIFCLGYALHGHSSTSVALEETARLALPSHIWGRGLFHSAAHVRLEFSHDW